MSDKMTTCPWCGIPVEKGTATDGEKDYWIVECPECGCFKVLGELKEEDE